MTDQELVELAELASVRRTGQFTGLLGLANTLLEVERILAVVPALVEELREARRRLAEIEGPKVEW